ncbi:YybH family protein [Sphingobium sp.]|uniref:YybH family protein n=1 Tax=Sphingobium sp. TaxID=1912891 RepID=UPI003B3B93A9
MRARLALLTLAATGLIAAKPPMRFQPDPSSVIAAEIAFNRMAQEKGQWTAFRETAADDAVMFVPERVVAKLWLKKQADPAQSVSWAPSIVYVSCDGNLAASTGNWKRPDGAAGYFTTIWRRDKKGRWQWILDHGDRLASPREAPEFMSGKVATCKRGARPDGPPPGAPAGPTPGSTPGGRPGAKPGDAGPPPDQSLIWTADVAADGSRQVTVRMWNGTTYDNVIDDRVKAGS